MSVPDIWKNKEIILSGFIIWLFCSMPTRVKRPVQLLRITFTFFSSSSPTCCAKTSILSLSSFVPTVIIDKRTSVLFHCFLSQEGTMPVSGQMVRPANFIQRQPLGGWRKTSTSSAAAVESSLNAPYLHPTDSTISHQDSNPEDDYDEPLGPDSLIDVYDDPLPPQTQTGDYECIAYGDDSEPSGRPASLAEHPPGSPGTPTTGAKTNIPRRVVHAARPRSSVPQSSEENPYVCNRGNWFGF